MADHDLAAHAERAEYHGHGGPSAAECTDALLDDSMSSPSSSLAEHLGHQLGASQSSFATTVARPESQDVADLTDIDIIEEPKNPLGATVFALPHNDGILEIPVDDQYGNMTDDADSSYENSFDQDDTCSLKSSITKYRFENGRRYHAYSDGAYWGPNDEIHNQQQDISHHIWLLTLDNQLYLAPIGRTPHNILDVGTGTGIWAIDMADAFPSAAVTGTDLSPIQPEWVTPNCTFEVDDVTLPWTYRPNTFDFIHIREMFGSITDWGELYAQAYRALKPGGYLENCERSVCPASDDNTIDPDHAFAQYGKIMTELGRKVGKEFDIWKDVKDGIVRAGFVDVVETRTKWPIGPWSSNLKMKELGRWNMLRIEQGLEGFLLRVMTSVGEYSVADVQDFISRCKTAMKDRTIHAYLNVTVVYGRKPFDGELT